MRTSNGQNACSDCKHNPANSRQAAKPAQKINKELLPSQADFIDLLMSYDVEELSASFKLLHDLVIYHTDVPIEVKEKSALYFVKCIAEGMDMIAREA
jgi:hypothetical protein